MLALDRLAAHDLAGARLLLRLMRESGHWAFARAAPEYAPFAYSLAGALQDLVRAGALTAGSSFWALAFEGVLLELLDAHGSVHQEALRLLILVAKALPPQALAGHLDRMLAATRESRATARTRKAKYRAREARARREAEEFEQLAGGYLFSAGGGGLQSEWSDGFRAVRSLKYGGDENFTDLYRRAVFVGGLAERDLPDSVRAFLREGRGAAAGGGPGGAAAAGAAAAGGAAAASPGAGSGGGGGADSSGAADDDGDDDDDDD